MNTSKLPRNARYFVFAPALSLLLNTTLAQVANTEANPPTPDSTAKAVSVVSGPIDADSALVMSPFEVSSTQDTGYRARDTLAGSRISTDLNDLAGPLTVVTKDFMNDIGAVNVNDILTYEVGAEGAKDFSPNGGELGRTSDNAASDPNSAIRGRGLAPFDVTRDYFYSLTVSAGNYGNGYSVGFDSYNLDSITIVRGADSILAGLGSPAGIINYSPQLAGLDSNAYDAVYRFGSYGDKRATLNANLVAIPGVLAFRVAGAWSEVGYEQQPAFDHDKRFYLAGTWKPFKKTTIRASVESVNIDQHLPNTFTPEDDITQWLALGKPSSPAVGVNTSSYLSQKIYGSTDTYYNANGSLIGTYNDTTQFLYYEPENLSNVGIWQPLRFSNDEYGNWHKINTFPEANHNRLDTVTASIDQNVLPGLTLNGAFLHENSNFSGLGSNRPDFTTDSIDVNEQLPWGAPNPNYGETYMYVSGLDARNTNVQTNLVARLSATYDLNLKTFNKWLGRYVFTGFIEHRRTTGDSSAFNIQQAGTPTDVSDGPGIYVYTGGTEANGYYQSTGLLTPFLQTNAPFFSPKGVVADNYTTVYSLQSEQKDITKLGTSAVVLQSYLLDDLAVGTFGLRRDKDEAGYLANSAVDPATGVVDPLPGGQYDTTLSTVQAQTKTYGVVLHGTKAGALDLRWLSLAFNHSENFIPNAGSIDLLGNPTPSPTGVTKDMSVIVDLFGGRLNAKIDWFTNIAANGTATLVSGSGLAQYTLPFLTLQNNGVNGLGAYADLARQAGLTSYTSGLGPGISTGEDALANGYTENEQSKGMEFELTYNVTKNWRLFGTVTREQAEESQIAPGLTALINKEIAYWQANGLWNGPYTTKNDWSGQPETGQQVFDNDVLAPFVNYQSVDGQPSQQLHKWKATLVTNYTFGGGFAKGFGAGTGLRWFDRTIIGNPAIYSEVNGVQTVTGLDLAHPYTVPGQTTVEAWLTYSRKVFRNRFVLSFRLEADNLQSGGGYMAVNANSDGTHQLFKIMPPRTYYFTTELKF